MEDVVTIDSTTGTLSCIRIRATTIVNYDKQELLIPNKEFITGRVINWILTDKMNRVVITVGVAYGNDIEMTMALMLEAEEDNENILDYTKSGVSFGAFGENSSRCCCEAIWFPWTTACRSLPLCSWRSVASSVLRESTFLSRNAISVWLRTNPWMFDY